MLQANDINKLSYVDKLTNSKSLMGVKVNENA